MLDLMELDCKDLDPLNDHQMKSIPQSLLEERYEFIGGAYAIALERG